MPTYRCLHYEPLPEVEPGMTNFDHTIDDGMVEAIADGEHMAEYAGWDFHAYVYLVGAVYVADVHRYHAHVGFVTADSPQELMHEVSHEYGAA